MVNLWAVRAPPRTLLVELTRLPQTPSWWGGGLLYLLKNITPCSRPLTLIFAHSVLPPNEKPSLISFPPPLPFSLRLPSLSSARESGERCKLHEATNAFLTILPHESTSRYNRLSDPTRIFD